MRELTTKQLLLQGKEIQINKKPRSLIKCVKYEDVFKIAIGYKLELTDKDNKESKKKSRLPSIYLAFEKIPLFIRECLKKDPDRYHQLDENILADLKYFYSHLIEYLKELEKNQMSQAEINLVYAAAYKLVAEAIFKAVEKGKQLLILVGETHYWHQSNFVNLLIYSIAKDFNLSAIGLECTQSYLDMCKNPLPHLSNITSEDMLYLAHMADREGIITFPMERTQERAIYSFMKNFDLRDYNPGMSLRDNHMVSKICERDGDLILALIGESHLKEISDNQIIKQKFEMLKIDSTIFEDTLKPTKDPSMYLRKKNEYIEIVPESHHLAKAVFSYRNQDIVEKIEIARIDFRLSSSFLDIQLKLNSTSKGSSKKNINLFFSSEKKPNFSGFLSHSSEESEIDLLTEEILLGQPIR